MARLGCIWRHLRTMLHLMVGLPDYATYVAHREALHPGEPIMSRAAFFREHQERRYGRGGGSGMRCC